MRDIRMARYSDRCFSCNHLSPQAFEKNYKRRIENLRRSPDGRENDSDYYRGGEPLEEPLTTYPTTPFHRAWANRQRQIGPRFPPPNPAPTAAFAESLRTFE